MFWLVHYPTHRRSEWSITQGIMTKPTSSFFLPNKKRTDSWANFYFLSLEMVGDVKENDKDHIIKLLIAIWFKFYLTWDVQLLCFKLTYLSSKENCLTLSRSVVQMKSCDIDFNSWLQEIFTYTLLQNLSFFSSWIISDPIRPNII